MNNMLGKNSNTRNYSRPGMSTTTAAAIDAIKSCYTCANIVSTKHIVREAHQTAITLLLAALLLALLLRFPT